MAKEPHTADPKTKEAPATEGFGETVAQAAQPGPDEPPPDQVDDFSLIPDPAVFAVPEPVKLTPGQIGGLQKDGLEAYLFGERVRHDAAGRRWDFRREAVADRYHLMIRVQIGPMLLGQGGLSLDRLPSADGEHQLLAVIESMAHLTAERMAEAHVEQRKTVHAREAEQKKAEKAAEHDAEQA